MRPLPQMPDEAPVFAALASLRVFAALLERDPDEVFVQGLDVPCTCGGEQHCNETPIRLADVLDDVREGIAQAIGMLMPIDLAPGAKLDKAIAVAVGHGAAVDIDGVTASATVEIMLETGQLLQAAVADRELAGTFDAVSGAYRQAVEALTGVSRETRGDRS